MELDAYRLWQQWQAMHYPRRGMPEEITPPIDLVALDGVAGRVLERYFCRGPRAKTLDATAIRALEDCQAQLRQLDPVLTSDARRYFGRLNQLLDRLLVEELTPPADELNRGG